MNFSMKRQVLVEKADNLYQSVHENSRFHGQIVIFGLCFQPLMAGDAVERNEGDEDRGLADVGLEFRVGSIG